MAKLARDAWEKETKAAIRDERRPPSMPSEATYDETYIPPRLYVTDSTIEALALQLKARPQGMIVIIEELARLFVNMQRHAQGSDSEFWLEAHDGNPWHQIRVSRAPIDIPHLLIGLIGGLQPDKLQECFKGPADGMYARFLFCWPEQPPYRKLQDGIDLVDPKIVKVLKRLAYLDDLTDKHVRLIKQAKERFERLRRGVNKQRNTFFGREREWFAKVPRHVLRLSGTLAYLTWALECDEGDPEPKIQSVDIDNAVTMVEKFFWPHARAALRQIGLDDQHADARRVLQWLSATGKHQVSNEEVRRNPLGKRVNAARTRAILKFLQQVGWLRPYTEKTKGRSRQKWEVSPKMSET